jgi:hypothetical protein
LQLPKLPAASRLTRIAIFACARAGQPRHPMIEEIFSAAAEVMADFDHFLL